MTINDVPVSWLNEIVVFILGWGISRSFQKISSRYLKAGKSKRYILIFIAMVIPIILCLIAHAYIALSCGLLIYGFILGCMYCSIRRSLAGLEEWPQPMSPFFANAKSEKTTPEELLGGIFIEHLLHRLQKDGRETLDQNMIDAAFQVVKTEETPTEENSDKETEEPEDEDPTSWVPVENENPNTFGTGRDFDVSECDDCDSVDSINETSPSGRPESLVEQDRRAHEDYVRELHEALANRRKEQPMEHPFDRQFSPED